ncbi:FAD-dependent oxidoreductase [Thalassotalea atypica]|uniref:FAD-dependent oxidoreductase n=1 Tax=Thalassotalea atypica TaxID=2054316 RepID=UPI0025748888|nr:FAD-dependent oxidoreductase [Thalassotalea atypica]
MKLVDCIVVGGGMVGAAAALSLAQLGLSVTLVEKSAPNPLSPEQPVDLRVSAISLASEYLLEQLGAWPQIRAWRCAPYKRLGVWESELAYTEFNADDIDQPYLGHIIENRSIQLALWQQIEAHDSIELICPSSVESLSQVDHETTGFSTLSVGEREINARLIVAADGGNSFIRKLAGIGCTGWQYQQSAMLIHVQTSIEQQDITWQQFTPSGPMAMLPLSGNQASLVWYHHKDEIRRLSALSNQALQERVLAAFPEKLGDIKVLNKASFPLTRQHANSYVEGRVVLLGDAAHSINPLAGQGVNLGFKDVKALQTIIATAIGNGELWHQPHVLVRYEKARRTDNALMMTGMDALYKGFSNDLPLFKLLRNTGLFVAQRVPILKSKALAYACGIE